MAKHYCYGGGMVGCLYDYGPNFCESKDDAIDSMVELYLGDLSDEDIQNALVGEGVHRTVDSLEADMRECLSEQGIFYFPNALRCTIGAHYCDVSEHEGECPESDDV